MTIDAMSAEVAEMLLNAEHLMVEGSERTALIAAGVHNACSAVQLMLEAIKRHGT